VSISLYIQCHNCFQFSLLCAQVLESSKDPIAQRSTAGAMFNLSLDRQALAPLEQKGVAVLCANAFATWRTVPLPVLERLLATYAHLRLVLCVLRLLVVHTFDRGTWRNSSSCSSSSCKDSSSSCIHYTPVSFQKTVQMAKVAQQHSLLTCTTASPFVLSH
jgi:hypothetical protein